MEKDNDSGSFMCPPANQIKTIEIDNCQDCPIVLTDNYYGYNGCALMEVKLVGHEEMPENKVHDECSLKNMNYRIRLK